MSDKYIKNVGFHFFALEKSLTVRNVARGDK